MAATRLSRAEQRAQLADDQADTALDQKLKAAEAARTARTSR